MIEIKVPYIEDSETSRISCIFKKAGDLVFKGDTVASLENDKFVFDVESNFTGIIEKVLKTTGDSIKTDDVLFEMSTDYDSKKYDEIKHIKAKKPDESDTIFTEFSGLIKDYFGENFGKLIKNGKKKVDDELSEVLHEETNISNCSSESKELEGKCDINTENSPQHDSHISEEEIQNEELDDAQKLDDVQELDDVQKAFVQDSNQLNTRMTNLTNEINEQKLDSKENEINEQVNNIRKAEKEIATENMQSKMRLTESQQVLKKIIKNISENIVDKSKDTVFTALTDKCDISFIVNMMLKYLAIGQNDIEKKYLYPIFIKSLGYALDKTPLFNKYLINVILECDNLSTKTAMSNVQSKSYEEILSKLSSNEEHSGSDVLLAIINESSTLSQTNCDDVIVFNKVFEENNSYYVYVTIRCSKTLTSVFFNRVKEFLENPLCSIM